MDKITVRRRRPRTFATQMVSLTLGVLLPLLALLGVVVYRVTTDQLRDLEREMHAEALGLARAVDDEMGRAIVQVRTLGEFVQQNVDLAGLHAVTQKSLRPAGYNVVVHDADGWQLMNGALPLGSQLGRSPNMDHLQATLASDQPVVSDIVVGAMRRLPVVSVSHATRIADRTLILNVTVTGERLRQVAENSVLRPDHWRWGLTDSKGVFVARSHDHATFVGQTLPDGLLAGSQGRDGVAWQVSVDGTPILRSWARTEAGWLAAVAVPSHVALAPLWTAWGLFGLTVAALLGLSFAIAQYYAKSLQAAVIRLQHDASSLGRGETVDAAGFGVHEFQIIHDSMAAASRQHLATENRRQLLVRELQHRTKNLLAVVLSLTRRIVRGSPELDAARTALSGRLQALAHGTDALSHADWTGAYVQELVAVAMEPFGTQYEATGPNVLINPQWSLNLSLILHELATNAAKHGALSVPAGRVSVAWRVERGAFRFAWTERGGPLVVPPDHQGFGRHLLRMMTHDPNQPPRISYNPAGFEYVLDAPAVAVLSPDDEIDDPRR